MVEKSTATLLLAAGREKPVLNRHPWVFSGATARVQGHPQPGDLVEIAAHDGRPLALAYYNPRSQIQARVLTWEVGRPLDEAFWRGLLERALAGRAALQLEPATTAYRLVNAEADGLPGLIVDRYGDYLVIQCLTLGVERRKEMLVALLAELIKPAGILERSDVNVRAKEGLSETAGLRWGQSPPADLVVLENGHRMRVNLQEGHKTGLYLDQRDNRAIVGQARFVAGRDVLNVFAYTGGFALYAASEAQTITNVDSSAALLQQAEENMRLNGHERPQDEYVAGDAFQILRHYRDGGRAFDVVILDPPKFVHHQGDLERASRGYKDLNWLALRLLRPGGLLATFSCSGLVSAELFQKIVFGAAVDAHRDAQVIQPLSQAADHPILLTFPESAYLKGLLCRVW
ncbi:MAG: class I SAM-dependent rRNA methyltransferase [Chloroflexota bacterium]